MLVSNIQHLTLHDFGKDHNRCESHYFHDLPASCFVSTPSFLKSDKSDVLQQLATGVLRVDMNGKTVAAYLAYLWYYRKLLEVQFHEN